MTLLAALLLALSPSARADDPPKPKKTHGQKVTREFRLTHYWLAKLKTAKPADGVPISDQDGNHLAYITKESKRELDLEGTGEFVDGDHKGTRINWVSEDQSADGNVYKVVPKGKWGSGNLQPFLTVAADFGNRGWKDYCTRDGALVPHGTDIYIKELDGMAMEDGTQHDGWVRATDTGGSIYGLHLDLFCGYQEWCPKLPKLVTVTFDGIDEIPADYAYGLEKKASDKKRPWFCEKKADEKENLVRK